MKLNKDFINFLKSSGFFLTSNPEIYEYINKENQKYRVSFKKHLSEYFYFFNIFNCDGDLEFAQCTESLDFFILQVKEKLNFKF